MHSKARSSFCVVSPKVRENRFNLPGDNSEAESMLAAAIEGTRKAGRGQHWHMGVVLKKYGECLTKLARFEDAESALLDSHRILASSLGQDHKRTLGSAPALRDLYKAWGEPERAGEWDAKLAHAD